MSQELLLKIGYYTIYIEKTVKGTKYVVDSGKTLYVARFKKYIVNPYRDVKEFKSLDKAKEYVNLKLVKKTQDKKKKLDSLPKSLYLVLIKEEGTGITFVKVGFTSKKFIMRRFSKVHGYDGYILETILRRIDTPHAEKLETEIKDKLNKKRSVKKYRPVLKSFSGYSECFDYVCLDDIIKIFDELVKTY
jgi:nitrogenase molybdenum-iron protein alpha/beta subunit